MRDRSSSPGEVVPYSCILGVSRLKNWIRLLALSQGSTRLWRTSHSMYSLGVSFTSFLRKIDSSILKKISIGKWYIGLSTFPSILFSWKEIPSIGIGKDCS